MIGFGELIFITIILLLVLGPSRITSMGPALGKAIRGFRQGLNGEDETTTTTVHKVVVKEVEKDITPHV